MQVQEGVRWANPAQGFWGLPWWLCVSAGSVVCTLWPVDYTAFTRKGSTGYKLLLVYPGGADFADSPQHLWQTKGVTGYSLLIFQ